MPITTRRQRHLSPLDEGGLPDAMTARVSDETPLPQVAQEGWDVLLDIGTAILTSRSYDKEVESCDIKASGERPRSLQDCEIFQPVNTQSLAAMKTEMDHLRKQGIPVCIEVKGQATPASPDAPPSLLLEQWSMRVSPRRSQYSAIPVAFLCQAVQSFLHFSQVRSWVVAWRGQLAFKLLYRVCAPGEDGEQFTSPPDTHTFPPAHLSSCHTLHVSVKTLPRQTSPPRPFLPAPGSECTTSQHTEKTMDLCSGTHSACADSASLAGKSPLHKHSVDDLSSQLSRMSTNESRGNPSRMSTNESRENPSPRQTTCRRIESGRKATDSFPFSPPDPSPMSPKLLSGLGDVFPYRTHARTTGAQSNGTEHVERSCFDKSCLGDNTATDHVPKEQVTNEETPVLTSANSGNVIPPAASSPMPYFRLRSRSNDRPGNVMNKRRSCAISVKCPSRPRPPVRSNSCPAVVPSLCLLGTFEESVLNGRLEPCGYVDGFTAELGASGSFRPAHISLPVGAAYFSLHAEHGGGSSPYLGHIDLSGVGRKGYRVPKKGTLQLTLFNPHQTVVKMYIVTYDLSDMPPHTQTFLRQKTLSKPSQGSGSIPALHYLINLRFHCSKSSHVYLHKDIKIIFARRAPDTMDFDPSRVTVYTIAEGPSKPKYCPIHS